MDSILFYIVAALGVSTILNLLLRHLGISQIVGYILTGIIIVYGLDLRHLNSQETLMHIGDFGVVFLMFTIGLELSLTKMNDLKKEIFLNGSLQVVLTTAVIYLISHFVFFLEPTEAVILSLAFSLSSTAVVLSYLKSSKEINNPYGQRATGILVFQDIAVIPILIFLSFLTADGSKDITTILTETALSAVVVLGLLFVIGRRVMTWLLHFSASSEVDEFFMASVLFIVIGAALLASSMGFTYSLGAFVAGMIIAETKYHHKVESDIAPFKDILLGTFFIVVGMKVDVWFLANNFGAVLAIFSMVLLIKTAITYGILRLTSSKTLSIKTSLALSQVGEFSFVIFAVASTGGLLDRSLESLFVLVVIFSMFVAPFFINKINRIVNHFSRRQYLGVTPELFGERKDHVIVCGYGSVGKYACMHLDEFDASYVVIDNNPKEVQNAIADGREAYLGDMSKLSLLNILQTQNSAAVIVTLDNPTKARAICETVLAHTKNINLVVKVASRREKEELDDLNISVVVNGKMEVARVLVERMMTCQLSHKK